MKKYMILLLVILGVQGEVHAAHHYMTLDQMTTYADNAILDAAQDGLKAVTLKFTYANPALVEQLADDLRARGYALDEEAILINPGLVKVRFLKNSAIAKLQKLEVTKWKQE